MVTQASLTFLKELAANNDRDWFHANKSRYERDLRDPWKAFVTAAIERLASVHADFSELAAKDCIFRIHRDTRFSKDKAPYKLNVAAGINVGGKTSSEPGVYLQASPSGWLIGGGAYWLSPAELTAVRSRIAAEPESWLAARQHPEFVAHFGDLLGDRNKRLPKEFQGPAAEQPDLFLKQFYYMSERPTSDLIGSQPLDVLEAAARAAEPVRLFLREALHTA
jgi:uncharacterized protein (TIGR02453 family)